MCYSLHATYACTPAAPSPRADPHTTHSTVLCASSTPCASPHWESRSQHWPTACPNCTGEDLPRTLPVRDVWAPVPASTHASAAERYLRDYLGPINAYLAAHTATSSPDDFLRWYPVIYAEGLCREHGEKLCICECHGRGGRTWEYNAALDLRSHTASVASAEFLRIPAVAATISGSLRSETQDLVRSVSKRCPALILYERDHAEARRDPPEPYIHARAPPRLRLTRCSVFAEGESARRLDVSICARDYFLHEMQGALSSAPYHVARVAGEAMRFRAQVVRVFSVPVITDAGLSPHRAGLVLERLSSLHLDPTFFPDDCPPEFDETRALLGGFARCASRKAENNPVKHLGEWFAGQIAAVRRDHARELERAVAIRMAFDRSTEELGFRVPTSQLCPAERCKRGDFPEGGPRSLDPGASHVERVRVRVCGHVVGRQCAFRRGVEMAQWDGGWGSGPVTRAWRWPLGPDGMEWGTVVWRCPVCLEGGEGVKFGHGSLFTMPWMAAVDGTMERLLEELQVR